MPPPMIELPPVGSTFPVAVVPRADEPPIIVPAAPPTVILTPPAVVCAPPRFAISPPAAEDPAKAPPPPLELLENDESKLDCPPQPVDANRKAITPQGRTALSMKRNRFVCVFMILHSPALAYNLLACHVVRHDCAQPVR